MKRYLIYPLTILTAVVFTWTCTSAQETSSPQSTPSAQKAPRIAVVDLVNVLRNTTVGKAVLERLETEEAEKKRELRTLEVDLMSIEERIRGDRYGLSQDKKIELQQEYERKLAEYRKKAMEAERMLDELQSKQFAELNKEIGPIIEELAKERGYDLIFDRPPSGLVYVHTSMDITPDVIKRVEEKTKLQPQSVQGQAPKAPSPAKTK